MGEIERDKRINGLRDVVLDRNGSGMVQKWPLEKLNAWLFLLIQINTINKLSIKLGGFQILQSLWCRNIRSHNAMFCHKCYCKIFLKILVNLRSDVLGLVFQWCHTWLNSSALLFEQVGQKCAESCSNEITKTHTHN